MPGNLDMEGMETSDPRSLKELLTPGRSVADLSSRNPGSHRSGRRSGRSGRSSGRRSGRSLDRRSASVGSAGSESDGDGQR